MAADEAAAPQSGPTVTQSDLDTIAAAAMSQWIAVLGQGDSRLAALGGVSFEFADLAGAELGYSEGSTVLIDIDAAGHGWFVDASPASSSEFRVRLDRNILAATPDSEAYERMDLVTVVEHEIGHLLGFEHGDADSYAVMHEDLDTGVRYVLDTATTAAAATPDRTSPPVFDAYAGYVRRRHEPRHRLAGRRGRRLAGEAFALRQRQAGRQAAHPISPRSWPICSARIAANAHDAGFDSMGRDLLGKDKGR